MRTFYGLDAAAEGNSLLELSRDVLRDELRVQIGAADLNDVEGDGLAELLLDGLAQLFDVFAALADDDARAGAVDVDLDLCVISFDLDLGDAGGIEGALEILTNVVVLNDQITDLVLTGIPARVPVLNYANAQSMGINFLSHSNLLLKPSRSHRW